MNCQQMKAIKIILCFNKNEIAAENSIKLIETSLTETGAEASTKTGGLTLGELQGLDKQ